MFAFIAGKSQIANGSTSANPTATAQTHVAARHRRSFRTVLGLRRVRRGEGRGAIEKRLASLGAKVVSPGPAVRAGAPLSLWQGPDAAAADVEEVR